MARSRLLSTLDDLLRSNLVLDQTGWNAGEGPYEYYFLCADIPDEKMSKKLIGSSRRNDVVRLVQLQKRKNVDVFGNSKNIGFIQGREIGLVKGLGDAIEIDVLMLQSMYLLFFCRNKESLPDAE